MIEIGMAGWQTFSEWREEAVLRLRNLAIGVILASKEPTAGSRKQAAPAW